MERLVRAQALPLNGLLAWVVREMMASQPLFNVYQAQLVMLNTLTQKQNNLAHTQLVTADGEVILLLPIVLGAAARKN